MPYWRESDPEIRANIRRGARIRREWPTVARNVRLRLVDDSPRLADRWNGEPKAKKPRILVPPFAGMEADQYGLTMHFETINDVGEVEFRERIDKLRNAWRMRRVNVTEPEPGLLRVRAVYRDPMTIERIAAAPGLITDFEKLFLGPDLFGEPVFMPLANGSGATVAGNPGYGKTNLLLWLITQFAPSRSVQFLVASGKAPSPLQSDYRPVAPRVSNLFGKDPKQVYTGLKQLQAEMNRRYLVQFDERGTNNFWQAGPTPDWPLIVAVLDECQTWMDDREIVAVIKDIIEKCRGAGIFLVFAVQKPTDTNMPTEIRDLATSNISMPVRTSQSAVAALGDDIREYKDMSPHKFMRTQYRGVGTIGNQTEGGFVQWKAEFMPDALALAVANATAHYVADIPGITAGREHRAVLAAARRPMPDDLSELLDTTPPAPEPAPTDRPRPGPRPRRTRPAAGHRHEHQHRPSPSDIDR